MMVGVKIDDFRAGIRNAIQQSHTPQEKIRIKNRQRELLLEEYPIRQPLR
jgi:hypothetical protein